tara:strand:+ start:1188 stop:1571 length:384 start_codon:yes stop_codon:yes gene_type:complete
VSCRIVIASENLFREIQTYNDCYVWLNLYNKANFVEKIFRQEKFDIFGILVRGMTFANEKSAETIIKLFEAVDDLACITTQETANNEYCVFINTKLTGAVINTKEIIENQQWKTVCIGGLIKPNGKT